MATLIELKNVSKVYERSGRTAAVEDLSLRIAAGEFVAIMGASGSGKSTLLNLIAGLDRPTSGTVEVAGMEVSALGESALARYRRQHLGFVFQFFNLLANLRVVENVLVPAQLAGVPPATAARRAAQLLDELGIADRAQLYPAQLSGGERQRVAIARALVNRPSVLLADEPTGALDSRSGEQVMDLLARLNGGGQTIVLVTHDAKLAAGHARRMVTLRDGRIVDDAHFADRVGALTDLVQVRGGEAAR